MKTPDNLQTIRHYLVDQFELSDDQINEMLPVFIDTIFTHMENLEEMFNQQDMASVKKMGHTLKGALLNLGLEDIADLAFQVEHYPDGEKGLEECQQIVTALRREIDTLSLN